jgi:predicted MPP superfamily phosphohydrolase
MTALDWLLALVALLGHFALFVATFNRLHGMAMYRPLRRYLELLLLLGFLGVGVWHGLGWWQTGAGPAQHWRESEAWPSLGYGDLCLLAAVAVVPYWLWPRMVFRNPAQLLSCESWTTDVEAELGPLERHGTQARLFARFPGNEVYKLQTNRKTLQLASLPSELAGLTITHLSDLHFTGELSQAYFDHVVDAANRLTSDAIVLSGDIIESEACLPWLTATLGRLQAPLGKYFVLGNHDKRMPQVDRVRQLMRENGWIDLGGQCHVAVWKNCRVLLAGNEQPWFPAVADPTLREAQEAAGPDAFRLLVAHSPDQLRWARRRSFPLMLAGHNHGGQIRFPLIGPLVAPSLHGTRYAGGLYYEAPTLLHVSRGIGGEHPLRWNCLPELTQLVLK